jgi:hypothetical protein
METNPVLVAEVANVRQLMERYLGPEGGYEAGSELPAVRLRAFVGAAIPTLLLLAAGLHSAFRQAIRSQMTHMIHEYNRDELTYDSALYIRELLDRSIQLYNSENP